MKRLSVLIGLMVALFFSCSVEVEETAVSENLKVKAQLQLSVNSLLGGDVPGTRAIAGLEETAINNLTVLQFDANEKLVYKEYLSSTTLNIVDGKLSNELDLDAGTSTIWFVANTAETDIHDKLTVNTSTLENFKALSFKLATGTDVVVENGMAYDSTYLRASGYWKGDVPGSDNFISATLYPLAAKLTVNYEIVNGEGSINNIQVWNVPLQMAYSTTPDNNVITTAETTAYNVCSLQDEQTDDTNTNTQGSVSFYVTENITNIESDNTEPGRKNDSASGHNPIFIKLDGTYKSGDTDVPFTINLYPGADNCKDFNVKINHNYQVNLMLDISNIEKWVDDKRISTKFDLPYQDKLVVRYEFDTKNKAYNSMYSKEQKALFGTDGTVSGANDTDTTNTQNGVSVKITTGNLIRNLAGNGDTYCTLRGEYDIDFNSVKDSVGSTYPRYQRYNAANNYMEYSGLAFDTGHGKDETIKSERTIIFIGGFGRKNKNGCMAYGVYNGGFDAAGSTRWYMYVSSSSQFRYGVLGSGSQDIPNYTYTYENENPKIFFCADRCVVNTDGSAVRELMVDGFYAKALNVAPKTGSEKFLSNFFLGNNAYEPRGFSSTDARLYLFLIYERTLTNAEISQIQAYARSKGYIE